MEYNDAIANSYLLNHFKKEEIDRYIKGGVFKLISHTENRIIHFKKDQCSNLEIILKGQVIIEHFDKNGRLKAIIRFNENDMLGCNLIFSESPYYPATIAAKEPTIILSIRKEELFGLLLSNSTFFLWFLRNVSHHTTILYNIINLKDRKTIRESLMYFLRSERKRQKSKHIKLNITKKALAEQIGVQRTSLSRELANMRKDGLVTYDSKSITINFK